MGKVITLAVLLLTASRCSSYYLTASLQTWNPDEGSLYPFVNSLTSVDAVIPFEFYDLKYCKPEDSSELKGLGLGMMLRGDHVENSLYEFEMLTNSSCKRVPCAEGENKLSAEDAAKFERYITSGYRANMILDNLPMIATEEARMKATHNFCSNFRNPWRKTPEVRGSAIGGCDGNKAFIYNHFNFIIHYNKLKDRGIFVAGFQVNPDSHADIECGGTNKLYIDTLKEGGEVHWTYSVTWIEKPDARWVTRWDYYLSTSEADSDAQAHWIKITQSLVIMLCLSALVVVIMSRTLHLDFNRYNSPDNDEELQEEVGWKLVHTDVFRPPPHPHLFAGVVGTGVQLIGMTITVLGAAIMGFLSPAFRGASITAGIFLFVLMAFFNGYVTGLMQMMFGIRSWKSAILSGVIYPGFVFVIWVFCDCMLAWRGAATAVPLSTILFIIVLWFGVCIPLIILGASFGFRQKTIENPLKYNQLERVIPPQRFLLSTPACVLFPGMIPFTASSLELRLILKAIWQGQVYYVFGFLTLVALVVMVSVCLTTIVYIYYQLVFENYRWWWRSMAITGGMSLYYFIYCVYYYSNVLKVRSWTGMVVYFSFTTVSAISIGIIVGTVGFFSAWVFIRKIYSSIKIE